MQSCLIFLFLSFLSYFFQKAVYNLFGNSLLYAYNKQFRAFVIPMSVNKILQAWVFVF